MADSQKPSSKTPSEHPAPPRRRFIEILAGGVAALLGIVPLGAALAVYLDPILRKENNFAVDRGDKPETSDGFLRVASKSELAPAGQPKRFQVIDDVTDKWNYLPNQPVGSVYLTQHEDQTVTALNTTCPHAGCSVKEGTNAEGQELFICPCHNSAFALNGDMIQPTPSPRAMDSLECQVRGDDVYVKYQDFYAGKSEKKPKK